MLRSPVSIVHTENHIRSSEGAEGEGRGLLEGNRRAAHPQVTWGRRATSVGEDQSDNAPVARLDAPLTALQFSAPWRLRRSGVSMMQAANIWDRNSFASRWRLDFSRLWCVAT